MPEIITKRAKHDILKERIKALKPKLHDITHWKTLFIKKHPEYDNLYSLGLLTSTLSLRTTDEEITDKLEAFVQSQPTK